MSKLIKHSFLLIAFVIIAVFLWDFLSPGMPLSYEECMSKGGTIGKSITAEGVFDNPNECVFEARNSKQERECIKYRGDMRVGGKCPCCSMTFAK